MPLSALPPVSAVAPVSGIERTATSIQRGQAEFDRRADALIRSVEEAPPRSAADPAGTTKPPGPADAARAPADLNEPPATEPAQAAVQFREQALVNQILYQAFRAQANQQLDLTAELRGGS